MPHSSCVTSDTAKKLLEIPHFSNLDYFRFEDIPEVFEIETFFSYIKVSILIFLVTNTAFVEKSTNKILAFVCYVNFWGL